MKRKTITSDVHCKMLKNNCEKGKHRLRVNKYGVCWCMICGLLSNTNNASPVADGDPLTIKMVWK